MTAPPGKNAAPDRVRTGAMSGEKEQRNAGLLAVVAAAFGLVAVVAIVLSGTGAGGAEVGGAAEIDGRRPDLSVAAGGGPSRTGEPEAATAPVPGPGAHPDGGLTGAEETTASVPGAPIERRDPAALRPTPEEIARDRAEAARVAATLTPEQRYEAQTFLNDLLILRVDQLRTQIATARAAGDERALRRLEPALAIVTEELARSAERMRALEAELGLEGTGGAGRGAEPGEAGEGTSPSTEPE
jgi:hypothetical protein